MKRITQTLATALLLFIFVNTQAQLAANAGADTTICTGGSPVTLGGSPTASLGIGPYIYQWAPTVGLNNVNVANPVASPLATTKYYVTVTDAVSTTAVDSVTIIVSALAANAGPDLVLYNCPGDSVIMGGFPAATGGFGNYSYFWSPVVGMNSATISNPVVHGLVTTTVFTVNITDNTSGCVASDQLTVSLVSSTLVAEAGNAQVICLGSSVTLGGAPTTSGGTAPYAYQWTPATGLDLGNAANPVASPSTSTLFSLLVTDAHGCTMDDTVTVYVTQLDASTTTTNVTCHGGADGAVAITATCGTSPYTFSMDGGLTFQSSNQFQNLTAGSYNLTVKDALNATANSSFTISQPTVLTINETHTNAACYGGSGGSINITPVGGTPGYTFMWSNGSNTQNQTNLAAAAYTVTVIDTKGCSATLSITISQPTQLTLSSSVTNILCHGASTGAIILTVSGGSPAYTFNWSHSITTQNPGGLVAGIYTVTVTDSHACTATLTATVSEPAATLSAPSTHTDASCHGASDGSITVNIIGGTPPYTFFGNSVPAGITTIPNLVANGYQANVIDANGCMALVADTILEPTPIQITTQPFGASCNGQGNGAVNITVFGGTPVYTYSWNDGSITEDISGLAAGVYIVTVTDTHLCSATASAIVTQVSPIILTDSIFNVSCYGVATGEIDLTATGGTGAYTYAWSNAATTPYLQNLSAGTYAVTVTDANNCTATLSAVLNQPAQIQITGVTSNVLCNGMNNGAIDMTVTGGVFPYNFFWSTFQGTEDVSGLSGGLYYVIVTDNNGCQQRDSFLIYEPVALVLDSVITSSVSCNGGSNGYACAYVSGGNSPYIYTWNNNATTQCIPNLLAGSYTATVTDMNGCTISAFATVNQPSALQIDSIIITDVSCYSSFDGAICVHVSGGTPVYSYVWSPATSTAPCLTGYPAGSYNVTITDVNNCTIVSPGITIGQSANQCVWPGDANYDGLVDNNDLLPIGLGNGTTGPARAQQDNNWYGHVSNDWIDTLAGGINYKHIDCNGSGTISPDDTVAILQNFSLTHPRSDGVNEWRMAVPALMVDLMPDTSHAGDTMYANLSLGDINTPANNIYGLAFTLNYDVNVVDTTKTHAVFGNSWLGTGVDKISIAKDLKQGQVKCAITRIDHTTRNGSGLLGQVSFVITTDNINGKNMAYYGMHVWLSDVVMIDNTGNYLQVNAGQDSTQIEFEPTGIEELEWQNAFFKIQPNPANDVVTLSVSQRLVGADMRIIGMDGKVIEEEKIVSPNFQIPTLNLADGIYMLQAVSGVRTLNKRLVIAR